MKKRLFGLRIVAEAHFNQHLDEFNKVMMELDSLEVKIEEKDKALLLLASLPSSFDNIVTTLFFGKHTLRLDEVVATLLMNGTPRGNNGFSGDDQVAMVTKESSRR